MYEVLKLSGSMLEILWVTAETPWQEDKVVSNDNGDANVDYNYMCFFCQKIGPHGCVSAVLCVYVYYSFIPITSPVMTERTYWTVAFHYFIGMHVKSLPFTRVFLPRSAITQSCSVSVNSSYPDAIPAQGLRWVPLCLLC